MLSFDIQDVLARGLAKDRRPPDGKLHPSGDLLGSLRHAQLRAAGAPTIESEIVSDTRLMTGTLWHSYFESIFRAARQPIMTEVKLDRWLPEGWSGTADWIIWDGDAFVLGDLKTIKGEGLPFVVKDGIKEEHLWQLSAYWYALRDMGLPLVRGFAVFYLPMNSVVGKDINPVQAWGQPIDEDDIRSTMEQRWYLTKQYLASLDRNAGGLILMTNDGASLVNEYLAPVQDRVQKILWNKATSVFDVKLVPHWSAQFCPYPNELCDCRTQGVNKIGQYDLEGEYMPYRGDERTPIPLPAKMLEQKRRELVQ